MNDEIGVNREVSVQTTAYNSTPAFAELKILISHADKYGKDIAEMSDFFYGYIHQLSCNLRDSSSILEFSNLPIINIGIINDVIHQMDAIINGGISYLPDFDRLPNDIRSKLSKGIYKLGESKQVEGNLRPVILDENGVRIKDITLKEVVNDHVTAEMTRSMVNQLQMRQIFTKLDSIQELQSYQIDRDRDRDIVIPFLSARDNILRAQNQTLIDQRREYLFVARDELTRAINAIYTDMTTSTKHLQKLTKLPLFQKSNQIKNYVEFLSRDIQLLAKFIGVQSHIFDYLGDAESANNEISRFESVISDFFSKPLEGRGVTAAMLVHQYFPYTEDNRNAWMSLSKEIDCMLCSRNDLLNSKRNILISMEDDNETT
jgi:hypothetical protein